MCVMFHEVAALQTSHAGRLRLDRGCQDLQSGPISVWTRKKNKRFITVIGREQHEAKRAFEKSNPASRVFADFTYRT